MVIKSNGHGVKIAAASPTKEGLEQEAVYKFWGCGEG
jgi:hypothetical protein